MSDTSSLPIPAANAPAANPSLVALLTGCENAATCIYASVPALASLTADLVARSNESIKVAVAQAASFRSAHLARKTRVLGDAKRLLLKQCKILAADVEAIDVSTEQLRVWAAVAVTGMACSDDNDIVIVDCAFAALPLLASPREAHAPVIGVTSAIVLPFGDGLGSIATGCGLRVVSAVGPGLKWFEPHTRNEFSVVLAQADGSVPVWLASGDVVVDVLSPVSTPAAACARMNAGAAVRSEWARLGTVTVAYYGASGEGTLEAVLHLLVCGSTVADAAGDISWCARVPRKPLAGHECAALGTHVRTHAVVEGMKYGMAVNAGEKCLVVGLQEEGVLYVYSLPDCELVRSFGGRGDGPLQFRSLRRLCFAPNGNLIVVDSGNMRLQEVNLEGVFVRFIGVGEFGGGDPFCVTVHDDVIAVGCFGGTGTGTRVVLFYFGTGAVRLCFGELGTAPGQLSHTSGIQFTPDGSHVIVAEGNAKRLSLFTTAGVFVRCVGVDVLGGGMADVLQSESGEYVVVDYFRQRVCIFSPDGSELVRSWGVRGTGDGQFKFPTALAAAGQHLYVMEMGGDRVQVFE